MMKPSIFDIKYNGLDMYETMRQVDRDKMLYEMAYENKNNVSQTEVSTYIPETKNERFLRYYKNVDIYIKGDCSDKDWEKIKRAKNINPYKKEYARLVADEFDFMYRGRKALSETQLCIVLLLGLIAICLIPFSKTYFIIGILIMLAVLAIFKIGIATNNTRVNNRLEQIKREKKELIKKMKGSK